VQLQRRKGLLKAKITDLEGKEDAKEKASPCARGQDIQLQVEGEGGYSHTR
jgi:hypothetical protein